MVNQSVLKIIILSNHLKSWSFCIIHQESIHPRLKCSRTKFEGGQRGSVAVNESTAVKGVVEKMNQVKEINFMVRYISWMNLFIAKIQQTIMVIHSLNLFPKNMSMSVSTICFNIFYCVWLILYESYIMINIITHTVWVIYYD